LKIVSEISPLPLALNPDKSPEDPVAVQVKVVPTTSAVNAKFADSPLQI